MEAVRQPGHVLHAVTTCCAEEAVVGGGAAAMATSPSVLAAGKLITWGGAPDVALMLTCTRPATSPHTVPPSLRQTLLILTRPLGFPKALSSGIFTWTPSPRSAPVARSEYRHHHAHVLGPGPAAGCCFELGHRARHMALQKPSSPRWKARAQPRHTRAACRRACEGGRPSPSSASSRVRPSSTSRSTRWRTSQGSSSHMVCDPEAPASFQR
mmetsp:Transcript_60703/g.192658  ORF Transcript_60703/g.192658 Transcript_60703/m.192658 type:complete len:212 (+) Transcript_60703:77-712(+)